MVAMNSILLFCGGWLASEIGITLLFAFWDPTVFRTDLQRYTISNAERARMEKVYDSELGWKNRYPTRFGERRRILTHDDAILSTFGDSFTYGVDVGDGETWQAFLAELLDRDVYNFGVPGYGVDQALIRFRSDLSLTQTPIVTLAFIPENINRIVSVYRKFYYPPTGIPMTKPRFMLVDKRLTLLPNPIGSIRELRNLQSTEFLARLSSTDWWFPKPARALDMEFPYTFSLLKKVTEEFKDARGGSDAKSDAVPRSYATLWGEESTRTMLFSILDAFVRESKSQGSAPILMMLGNEREVTGVYLRRVLPAREQFLSFCRLRRYLCFDGIGALAMKARDRNEIKSWFVTHPTAAGNRMTASLLADYLRAVSYDGARDER